MASKSFLTEAQIQDGIKKLKGPFPDHVQTLRAEFSRWLEERLLERLAQVGDFAAQTPILLGSWARHELCPKSDIDLLFADELAKDFIGKAFRAGLKLRARTPEDPADWSVGVDPFDILALKSAKAFTGEGGELLAAQSLHAKARRKEILKAIRTEREERRTRQDSISNFLEPNIKFGAGGLRDIEQALAVRDLFPEKFKDVKPYPFKVLDGIKEELLYVRCWLHLLGAGDILSAHDQLEVAKHLNMEAPQLMKFLQSELERASFYADWAVAHGTSRNKSSPSPKTATQAIDQLKHRPDIDLQFQIRLTIDKLCEPLNGVQRGQALHRAIYAPASDAYLLSLYRSRVLEVLIPDLKKLRGLVQHDHYHRFTADAHLVQTLREVQRLEKQKRSPLARLTRDLTALDWWTLKLTALFHDLAKGRKGDHSTEGAQLVSKYFKEWDFSESLTEDVRWLVENHLILSTAAFRQNPQAQSTWRRLFDRGVQSRRLTLLALFTAIDIRATNPEAWTEWKAQLLLNLVENLRSPQAQSLQRHLKYASSKRKEEVQEWLLNIDPVLLQALSPKILVDDLKAAASSKHDLPPKVIRAQKRLWVRFHRRIDETGIFLSFVKRLYGFGLNIQMSAVTTLPGVGVYDWFCLRTEKSARQVSQWLSLPSEKPVNVPRVQFQSIELMANDHEEWIFSFRGRDQRGLLLAAAQALVEENLSLRWARAHTWGQQIDDIFSVQPLGEVEKTIKNLRNRFVT